MAPPQEPQRFLELMGNAPQPIADEEPTDAPKNLQELIGRIHGVLGPDGGLDSEHINANDIITLMEQYSSNADDWAQYAMFDHSRAYTRNLVDDGNGKVITVLADDRKQIKLYPCRIAGCLTFAFVQFNLMILAWSKGQQR